MIPITISKYQYSAISWAFGTFNIPYGREDFTREEKYESFLEYLEKAIKLALESPIGQEWPVQFREQVKIFLDPPQMLFDLETVTAKYSEREGPLEDENENNQLSEIVISKDELTALREVFEFPGWMTLLEDQRQYIFLSRKLKIPRRLELLDFFNNLFAYMKIAHAAMEEMNGDTDARNPDTDDNGSILVEYEKLSRFVNFFWNAGDLSQLRQVLFKIVKSMHSSTEMDAWDEDDRWRSLRWEIDINDMLEALHEILSQNNMPGTGLSVLQFFNVQIAFQAMGNPDALEDQLNNIVELLEPARRGPWGDKEADEMDQFIQSCRVHFQRMQSFLDKIMTIG